MAAPDLEAAAARPAGAPAVGWAPTYRVWRRVALAAALVEGLGVTEYQPGGSAAAEIKALAAEVLKAAG